MRNTTHTFTFAELDAAWINLNNFLRNPTLAIEGAPRVLLPTPIQIAGGRTLKRLERRLPLKEEAIKVVRDIFFVDGDETLKEGMDREEYAKQIQEVLKEEIDVLIFQFDIKLLDTCEFNGIFIPHLYWWFDFDEVEDMELHENGTPS